MQRIRAAEKVGKDEEGVNQRGERVRVFEGGYNGQREAEQRTKV